MIKYRMELLVPDSMVSTVFDVMKGEGIVMSIEPVKTEHHNNRKPVMRPRSAETGKQLAFRLIKTAADGITLKALEKAFIQDGRSENSHGPCLSELKKEGKIRFDLEDNKWKIA